jgi:ligand-binding sensor domain-containing protein
MNKTIVTVLIVTVFMSLMGPYKIAQAADLVVTPIVENGEQLTLSVSGTSGEIMWTPTKGQIIGVGHQVTYIAPSEPGIDAIMVLDEAGNTGLVKITITPSNAILAENANWEVFTNRSWTLELVQSDDQKTLWIATGGGLEQRNVQTGLLTKVFTNLDGLPHNYVRSLMTDGQNGLWLGTEAGLAHLTSNNEWTIFDTENSSLPHNHVQALLDDGEAGLVHLSDNKEWTIFNRDNSPLPDNDVFALLSVDNNGIWIGSGNYLGGGGLVYLSNDEKWTLFKADNSDLPYNAVYALASDANGGIWVGTTKESGLAHLDSHQKWTVFNTETKVPDNIVPALISDNDGGLWVGGAGFWGGLAHLSRHGEWTIFNTDNSVLPGNDILAFARDGNNGLWIGTGKLWDYSLHNGGLVHLSANQEWTLFDTNNSNLPSDNIQTLVSDGEGGLWIGTQNIRQNGQIIQTGGLPHLSKNQAWSVFTTANSELPSNNIQALLYQEDGSLWIGTREERDEQNQMIHRGGLAKFSKNQEWTVFTTDNSKLPSNDIRTLVQDDKGGLWIGTHTISDSEQIGGLAYLSNSNEWQIFNTANSALPNNHVNALSLDDNGGIWIGTERFQDKDGGIAYLDKNQQWTVFNEHNSGLPDNAVISLFDSHDGNLWLGTDGAGLTRLFFSQKQALCANLPGETQCDALLKDKRAAILIHPNGSGSGYNQALAVDFMATYAYHSLHARGYDNDEIYFLSYKPNLDFNADALVDFNIIDAPVTVAEVLEDSKQPRDITVDDIRAAFEWAKQQGPLDQPLIVVFVDHGLPGELLINPLGTETLTAETFDNLLDDYQKATNNQVVVILEACHTGTLVPTLTALTA